MAELITIPVDEYQAEVNAAYAQGRADERRRMRDQARDNSGTDIRRELLVRYLHGKGWTVDKKKTDGVEYVDSRRQARIGVPYTFGSAVWQQTIQKLAEHHRKGVKEIEQEIKALRRQ